jgi:hypothetical protein
MTTAVAETRKQDARDGPRPLRWREPKSRFLFSLRSPRAEARGYYVSFGGASGFGMTTAVAENREQRRPLRSLQLAKGGRKQAGERIFAWASE